MNLIVSHSVYSCTLQPPLSSLRTCLSQKLARPHRPKQMQYASLGLQRVKGASIVPCTVQVAIRNGLTVPKSRARPRLHLQDFRTQPRACTQPTCTPLSPGSPLPLSHTQRCRVGKHICICKPRHLPANAKYSARCGSWSLDPRPTRQISHGPPSRALR